MFSGNRLIGWAWTARNHPEVDLRRWLCHYGACHISVRTQSRSSRTQIHTRYSATNVSINPGVAEAETGALLELDGSQSRQKMRGRPSCLRTSGGEWLMKMLDVDLWPPKHMYIYIHVQWKSRATFRIKTWSSLLLLFCVISLLLLSHFSLSSLAMSHFPSHYFSLIWISQ